MSDFRPFRHMTVYDVVLSVFSGAALGWFAWWFGGASVLSDGAGGSGIPLWVFELLGIASVYFVLLRVRGREHGERRRSRWVHLLWIPAILLGLLMIQIILTLRSCC